MKFFSLLSGLLLAGFPFHSPPLIPRRGWHKTEMKPQMNADNPKEENEPLINTD
jgi:hypothetical protein